VAAYVKRGKTDAADAGAQRGPPTPGDAVKETDKTKLPQHPARQQHNLERVLRRRYEQDKSQEGAAKVMHGKHSAARFDAVRL
jgi:hypothetical protein